ncbi:MAG: hypothetical protein RMJ38_00970, partial [candidate division WOR-3 bacterium]|nr:hypothetical protein [candidate division WOR-3 bacterium]MDW8150001.1 hypothetical protein [candidate division WOR-3 bacterium]
CKFYKNFYHGIVALEQTELNMKDCKIFGNGNKEGRYPQMWIENSIANIENTEVYESVNGNGIYVESGGVLLYKVRTYGNSYGVYAECNRCVAIKDCEIKDGVYP